MQSTDTILLAVLAALVLVILFQCSARSRRSRDEDSCEPFSPAPVNVPRCCGGTSAGSSSKGPINVLGKSKPLMTTQEKFSQAERAAWTPQDEDGGMQYSDYVTSQVTTPEVAEHHSRWVKEMTPYWGGAAVIGKDSMDEVLESAVPFVGLRRPRPVPQCRDSMYQVTELDPSHLRDDRFVL